jgi:hypothetical protein
MNDFTVKVSYKNKNLEDVSNRTYDFAQYTEMIKLELMRIIMDVEDAFYTLQGSVAKENWDDDTMTRFQKIRHKLLDQANAVERIPQNLYYKDVRCFDTSMSKMLADILNNAEK